MNYKAVYEYVFDRLEKELPSHITYHDAEHTKNVLKATKHIAEIEKIEGDDLILLETAALCHDIGFVKSHEEHEHLSCELAREILPKFGYSNSNIEAICTMIMATKLPQKPKNHLSEILCDADLYYLGGKRYDEYSLRLFNEFKNNGIVKDEKAWQLMQKDFLTSHTYFTNSAKGEQEKGKKKKLKEIQKNLMVKANQNIKPTLLGTIQDTFLIVIGVVISAFALKGFLVPNQFFDGGVSGIALLVSEIFDVNLGLLIFLLNLPLILVSYFSIGKRFALRTLVSIILLSICLWIMPDIVVTTDKLLIAAFGGMFLGIGIGLGMRAGAALDGIDVLAVYTFKKTSFSMTEIVMAINILIFSVAAFKFGIGSALYSILTYFAATLSIDYVVEGLQAHTGVTIISGKSEEIKYKLVNELGRGITVYKGERGFLPGQFEISSECDIIFTVISRLEMKKLKNLVYSVDNKAFIFANSIKEASGGILRKHVEY